MVEPPEIHDESELNGGGAFVLSGAPIYGGRVLTPDVRFEGFTAEDWQRCLRLFKPHSAPQREPTRPAGGLFVIHDGTRIRKVLHTSKGRAPAGSPWPVELRELAEQHQADWVVAAHTGALDECMERFGARAARGQDFLTQTLLLVAIVREMLLEGAIDRWPRRLRGVPLPSDAMVRRALDVLCPDHQCVVLGTFDQGELYTALVARRRGGAFDLLAGPDGLRPQMGLLSGDWRRDYRHLARAVSDQYGPIGFGCFAEFGTFRALEVDPRPGAWGRAVALRDIVLSPMPAAVGLALGFDGARYAAQGLRSLTEQFAPLGVFPPVLNKVRKRIRAVTGDRDLRAILGFDPMAILRALLER
jgi:hypothetical protein